jgi:TPR repeat protein
LSRHEHVLRGQADHGGLDRAQDLFNVVLRAKEVEPVTAARAQFGLAAVLLRDGRVKNTEGRDLLRAAAEHGIGAAQLLMSSCFQGGRGGFEKSEAQSEHWAIVAHKNGWGGDQGKGKKSCSLM